MLCSCPPASVPATILTPAASAFWQTGDVVRIQVTATRTHVRGADFAVEDVHGEGRNEKVPRSAIMGISSGSSSR